MSDMGLAGGALSEFARKRSRIFNCGQRRGRRFQQELPPPPVSNTSPCCPPQRSLQVALILPHMRVNPCDHRRVHVPHQTCQGNWIDSQLQPTVAERMTKHIEAQLNTDSVREPAEPAVHRKASPRHAILIPQKPAFGPFLDQPLHDCDCRVRQVNNTHTFLTFCLPGGKNQPCGMELNVSGFQPEQLLRSCSRFPSQGDKIFESLVRDKCPETCVQLGTYDELAGSCFWLFEIRNGRAINVAKLDRP